MKTHRLLIFAMFLLVSCGKASKPPTQNIDFPTLTPLPSKSKTPYLSSTRTITSEPFIPVLTLDSIPPLPVSIPSFGSEGYHLIDWSEQKALYMIAALEGYIDDRDEGEKILPYCNPKVCLQDLIADAIQETLLFFPETPLREPLSWRRAYAYAVSNVANNLDDEFVALLENGLNDGRFDPLSISKFLYRHRFVIKESFIVEDLFRDGTTSEIYWISTDLSKYDGFVFAIRHHPQGTYSILPIDTRWDPFRISSIGNVVVGDFNLDSVPEVVIVHRDHSHTMCSDEILILQWSSDRFINLSWGPGNPDGIWLNECRNSWNFDRTDINHPYTLEVKEPYFSMPRGHFISRYFEWNGYSYVYSRVLIDKPEEINIGSMDWLDFAFEHQDVHAAIALIEEALPIWDRDIHTYNLMQFRLGFAYALKHQVDKAQSVFHEIAAENDQVDQNMMRDVSQTFLNQYHQAGDVYRACQASIRAIENNYPNYLQVGDIQYAMGIFESICNLRASLRAVLETWGNHIPENVYSELLNSGINVSLYEEIDLDADEDMDWVIVVDTPGDVGAYEPWVLLNDESVIIPLTLFDFEQRLWWTPDAIETDAAAWIEPIYLHSSEPPIFLLGYSSYLYAFMVTELHQDLELARVLFIPMHPILDHSIDRQGDEIILKVILDTKHEDSYLTEYSSVEEYYVWNQHTGVFTWSHAISDPVDCLNPCDYYKPVDGAAATIETLLRGSDPTEVIPILEAFLSVPIDESRILYIPRVQYYLGLAFQLSSQGDKAREIYWKLWKDYPESPYAIMARYKIEPME